MSNAQCRMRKLPPGRWVCLVLAIFLLAWQPGWPEDVVAITRPTTQPSTSAVDLFKPSVITLHYQDAPLQTILKDFSKQAGDDMGMSRPEMVDFVKDKKATIDIAGVSFWEALRAIRQSTELGIHDYAVFLAMGALSTDSNRRLMLVPGGGLQWNPLPGSFDITGPFVVVAQFCELTHAVDYGHGMGGPFLEPGSLAILCLCEPKVAVEGPINGDCIRQVIDDNGNDLLDSVKYHDWDFTGARCTPRVQLREVPNLGKNITIKGVIKARLITKTDTLGVEDIIKSPAVTKTIGKQTITFTKATIQNNQTMLNFTFTPPVDQQNFMDPRLSWLGQLKVTDADGQLLQAFSMGASNHGQETELHLVVVNGKARKLVWTFTSETQVREFPFEIRDLPLPK